MKEIYFDNSATTATDSDIADVALKVMTEQYGNPSSLHSKGVEAERILEEARDRVKRFLGAKDAKIYFTSGGTESDNLAILGGYAANRRAGGKIVTDVVEHPAVLEPIKKLEAEGACVVRLPVDRHAGISEDEIVAAAGEGTSLVSIMLVNNELGTVEPIQAAARRIKASGSRALIHCDAVQAAGRVPINFSAGAVDLLSISGHKLHAPKGVGVLAVKPGVRLVPLFYGGGQQDGIRPGTENLPLIAAMGAAAQKAHDNFAEYAARVSEVRRALECSLAELLPEAEILSPPDGTDGILNIALPGFRAEVMLHFLEMRGIYVSSGSACARGKASHVIRALGLPKSSENCALRISIGRDNTPEQARELVNALAAGTREIIKT